MARKGQITLSIEAEIHGYQSQLNEIKKACDQLDPGASIAKSISKSLDATSRRVAELAKNLNVTLSSEEGIEKLKHNLQQVAFSIETMGMSLKQVKWEDLANGPAAELRKLESEIEKVQQNFKNTKISAFDKLLEDTPKLKNIFSNLKIDPKKMGIDEIDLRLKESLGNVESTINDINNKIKESQNKIDEYNRTIAKGQNLPLLAYDTPAKIRERAGLSKKQDLSAIDTNNLEYTNLFNDFKNSVVTNLAKGSYRKNNPALVESIRQQLEAPLQQLQEAKTQEAITTAINEIDKILHMGTGTGGGGGVRLTGTTGKNAQSWIDEFFETRFLNQNVAKYNEVVQNFRDMIDQLRGLSPEAAQIAEQTLQKISPLESANNLFNDFGVVAQRIKDGYKQIIDNAKSAEKSSERELTQNEGLKVALEGLKVQQSDIQQAQNLIAPVIEQLNKKIQEANEAERKLREAINEVRGRAAATVGTRPMVNEGDKIAEAGKKAFDDATKSGDKYIGKLAEIQRAQQGLNNFQTFIQRWFSVYAAVNLARKAFNSIKTTVKELDKVMTEIAIVTNMTQQDLWNQMSSYTDMAKQYAVSIKGVYQVSQLYYQQGLQQAEVMQLTEQTLKMARISGLDYAKATDYMTNAIRSFKMEMSDAQRVVDVYSAIAAKSATNTAELSNAMSKTASSAEAVGSSFENTTAMMAVMIEATRESSQNIGSALKSIISRYGEMKADPSKLIDSEGEEMSLNKVDKALQSVGISIQDANHQFRDFDDVIMELSQAWDTIDVNTQRYIATIMAGNRQQSRFLALVSNGERLAELSEEAANAEDASALQVLKTMDSIEAKAQQLQTSLQSMFTETGIENLYKGILDFGNQIIATFTNMPTIFNLPIPAILNFIQIFMSLGSSLTAAFRMLQDKLNVVMKNAQDEETAAVQKGTSDRINEKEREAAAAEKAARREVEAVERAQKEETNAVQRGVAERSGIKSGNGNYTGGYINPNAVDWNKFSDPKGMRRNWEVYYDNRYDQETRDIAKFNLMRGGVQINNQGQFVAPIINEAENANKAIESATKKTENWYTSLQQSGKAVLSLRMIGSSISMIAAGLGEATTGARHLKGGLQLVGGAMQTLSYAGSPWLMAFTAITTIVSVASTWIETAEERMKRLKNTAEDTNNEFLQKKSDYKNYKNEIEELEKLAKARHDSIEAEEEYIEASNKIAEQHPELVTAYDAEGNAIIDLVASYNILEEARIAAAKAAQDNHKAAIELAQEYEEEAKSNRNTVFTSNYEKFYSGSEAQKQFYENYEVYSNNALENLKNTLLNLGIENIDEFLLGSLEESLLLGNNSNVETNLRELGLEEQQIIQFINNLPNRYNSKNGKLRNDSNLLSMSTAAGFGSIEGQEYINEIISAMYADDAQTASDLISAHKDDLSNLSKEVYNSSTLFKDLVRSFSEYSGIVIDANADVQRASVNIELRERANVAQLAQLYTYGSESDKNVNTDAFGEFSSINELISGYMYDVYENYKSKLSENEKKDAYLNFEVEGYARKAYDTIYEYINEIWSIASKDQKQKFNDLLKNSNRYTSKQFTTELREIFPTISEELQEALVTQYYESAYNMNDFISAIGERQINGATLSHSTHQLLRVINSLGSEELQQVLSVYDTISKQIKDKQITPEQGQKMYNAYLDIWEATNNIEDTAKREAAQLTLSNWNDFSFAGLEELRQSLIKIFGKDAIPEELKNAANTFVKLTPKNLSVEMQSFADKATKNIEDFEKALKNASQGMDLKEATTLAQKTGKSLSEDFKFSDGKFFFGGAQEIKNAYLGETDELVENINEEYEKQLKALRLEQAGFAQVGLQNEAQELQEEIDELIKNHDDYIKAVKKYGEYAVNVAYIQNGYLEDFLTNINSQLISEDFQIAFKQGKWDTLLADKEIAPYVSELQKLANSLISNTFDKILESLESGETLVGSTAGMTQDQLDILKQFGATLDEKELAYTLTVTENNIQGLEEAITANVPNRKKADELLKKLHDIKFQDNLYEGFSGIVKSYDNLSYEAAQTFMRAIDSTDFKEYFGEADIAGNYSANYAKISEALAENAEKLGTKYYNELRAQLESYHYEKSQGKIIADIIQNRDKLSTDMIESLATMIGFGYNQLAEMLHNNGDGTYSINISSLQNLINDYTDGTNKYLLELLANQVDAIISSIIGLSGTQSKGFTQLGEMQSYMNKLNASGVRVNGNELDFQTMYEYNNTLHAYQLSTTGLIAQIAGMRAQLADLNDEQAEFARQLMQDTTRQLAENINVDDLISSIGTNQEAIARSDFRKTIEDYNAALIAMADAGEVVQGLDTDKLLRGFVSGGMDAVKAMQTVLEAQGKKLTAEQAEAAYRRQISKYVDAIDNIIAKPGEIVDKTTAALITLSGGHVQYLGNSGTALVKSAANLYEAYNRLLRTMQATGEATLADLNKVAALALENAPGENTKTIEALGDAAETNYSRLAEIFTDAGYQLTEDIVNQMAEGGILKKLGGGKLQILDFSAFADLMNLDVGSEEYVSAFKTFNDSLIEVNRQAERNILEEAQNVANMKSGDWVNVTQLVSKLSDFAFKDLNKDLKYYGGYIEDGILKTTEAANITAIIAKIQAVAEKSGDLIPSEIAELADAVQAAIKSFADLIKAGITGSLSNVQKVQLEDLAADYGVKGLTFTETAEGLKLSEESAIRLYQTINGIDALQGHVVFDELRTSLEKAGSSYENISKTTAHIVELQKQINNAKGEELEKLQRELQLAQEIQRVQSQSPEQYNFMGRDLPDYLKGPENYWNSVGQAYKAMNEASKTGYMEIEDFYNIVNEMSNLAVISGQDLQFMGETLSKDGKGAAELIAKGMSYLTNIDGDGVKISMKNFAMDIESGAADMGKGFDNAIDSMADSQIKMLDAMIQMLETIVAMEELGSIDTNGDGILAFGEMFETLADGSVEVKDNASTAAKAVLNSAEETDGVIENLKNIKINEESLYDMLTNLSNGAIKDADQAKLYQEALSTLYQAAKSGDWNLDDIAGSLKEQLKDLSDKPIEITGENGVKVAFGYGVEIQSDENGVYHIKGSSKDYTDIKEALSAQVLSDLGATNINSFTTDAGDVEATATLGVKQTIDVSYKNGQIYYKSSKINKEYKSLDKMIDDEWDSLDNRLKSAYHSKQEYIDVTYGAEIRAQIEAESIKIDNEDTFKKRTQEDVNELAQKLVNGDKKAVVDAAKKVGIEVSIKGELTAEQRAQIAELAGITTETKALNVAINAEGDGKEIVEKLLAETAPSVDITVNLRKGEDEVNIDSLLEKNEPKKLEVNKEIAKEPIKLESNKDNKVLQKTESILSTNRNDSVPQINIKGQIAPVINQEEVVSSSTEAVQKVLSDKQIDIGTFEVNGIPIISASEKGEEAGRASFEQITENLSEMAESIGSEPIEYTQSAKVEIENLQPKIESNAEQLKNDIDNQLEREINESLNNNVPSKVNINEVELNVPIVSSTEQNNQIEQVVNNLQQDIENNLKKSQSNYEQPIQIDFDDSSMSNRAEELENNIAKELQEKTNKVLEVQQKVEPNITIEEPKEKTWGEMWLEAWNEGTPNESVEPEIEVNPKLVYNEDCVLPSPEELINISQDQPEQIEYPITLKPEPIYIYEKTGGIPGLLENLREGLHNLINGFNNEETPKVQLKPFDELNQEEIQKYGQDAGQSAVEGVVIALSEGQGQIGSAAATAVETIQPEMNNALLIGSPSKVTQEIGTFVVEGLAQGLQDTSSVISAAQTLAEVVIQTIQSYINSNPITYNVQNAETNVNPESQTSEVSNTVNTTLNVETGNAVAALKLLSTACNAVATGIKKLQATFSAFNSIMRQVGSRASDAQGKINALSAAMRSIPNVSSRVSALATAMNNIPNVADRIIRLNNALSSIGGIMNLGINVSVNAQNSAGAKGTLSSVTVSSGTVTRGANRASWKHNIAYAAGKRTLMGELGSELVVTDGHYFLVGQDGPEFVDLAADAIVFNHIQTKKLLKNGSIPTRGTPITNERNATSLATGNTNGPAMASASAALAALKQIRAMWQQLKDASLKDLGAGAGGAGGGGGGGGGDDKELAAITAEIEEWYNWLRKIDELQKQLNLKEKQYELLMNDRVANGNKIYQNLKAQNASLKEEMDLHKGLYEAQEARYEEERRKMEENPVFNALYSFNKETGLLQRAGDEAFTNFLKQKGDAETAAQIGGGNIQIVTTKEQTEEEKKEGKEKEIETTTFTIPTNGMELLRRLTSQEANGQSTYTLDQQFEILKKLGFGDWMQYDTENNQIFKDINNTSQEERQKAVETFIARWENAPDYFIGIKDNIQEHKEAELDALNKIYENEQKIIDNQLDLEGKVMTALKDMRQAEIDEAQKTRDAYQKSADKYVEGLTDALNKERQMYQNEQSQNELEKLQAQLAILQRSGGSNSQIQNLQDQIAAKQQDMYFNERQQEIDAIKEASDRQLEKLDQQIQLMTELLAYEDEHGLLWDDVYKVMEGTPGEITDFIAQNTKDYQAESSLQLEQQHTEDLQSAQLYKAAVEDGFASSAAQEESNKEEIKTSIDEARSDIVSVTSEEAAKREAERKANEKSSGGGGGSSGSGGGGSGGSAPAVEQQETPAQQIAAIGSEFVAAVNKEINNQNSVSIEKGLSFLKKIADNTKEEKETLKDSNKTIKSPINAKPQTTTTKTTISKTGKISSSIKKHATGGLVDYTGLAWLDGTPSKPEYVLNAEQTDILRKALLGSSPASASLNNAAYNGISGMANSNTYNSIERGENIEINGVTMNLNVPAIANDYDAKRAGEMAFNEMMKIARKTGAVGLSRR